MLGNNPKSRGPIDLSQPNPYVPESSSSEEEKELAEQFLELLHGPAPPYVTPPLQAASAQADPPPASLDLGPSLMGRVIPSFSFPPPVVEEKKEEEASLAPGPSGLGFSLLRPNRIAWSPHATRDAVRRAKEGARYPAGGSLVAISGPVQRGKKYHHLRCNAPLYSASSENCAMWDITPVCASAAWAMCDTADTPSACIATSSSTSTTNDAAQQLRGSRRLMLAAAHAPRMI